MQESKPLSLRRNFSWTFIGNVVYTGCQWGMVVLLAKLGSPEMLGQFTLGQAVTAPIIMFTNLQLRVAQATDAKKQYLFSDYLGMRLISIVFALLLIAGISFSGGYHWETSIIILLVGLAKALESISDIFFGIFQQQERMDRIAMSLMIKGPLSLLMLGIGVAITKGILWGVVGLIIAWAIVLFAYDIRNGVLILKQISQVKPRYHFTTLKNLLWLCLPLGFVMMLISLNTNIPRYFIERYLGERELGIFAALAYLMVIGGIVVNALGESASPRLAKYYASGDLRAFRTLLIKMVLIATCLGGVGVLVAFGAGQTILSIFYRPEYAERWDIFIWLMVAAGIGYIGSFLGYGITATRAFTYVIIPYFIVSVVTAGFSWLLIPQYGLIGAAWVMCAASLTTCIMPLVILIFMINKRNTSDSTL